MTAPNKALMALLPFKDKHERGHFKRMMIEAQLCEEAARRAAMRSKEGKDKQANNGILD